MDLRLGWDLGREADQVKAQKRLSDEKPYLLILSSMCLAFVRWTRPLRASLDGDVVERAVLEEVVGE